MNQSNIESTEGNYPRWCCQKCGERIGYLGHFVEWLYAPLMWACKSIFHTCPGLFVLSAKEIPQSESDKRAGYFPVFRNLDRDIDKQYENPRTDQ